MAGTVLVFMKPKGDLADFDKWRNTAFDEIPGLQKKSILSSTDTIGDCNTYSYMNLYEISDAALITDSLIQQLLSSTSIEQHTSQSYWQCYSLLNSFRISARDTTAPTTVVTVGLTIKEEPEALADFGAWYTDEHMPGLGTVPGYCMGSRYARSITFGTESEYAAPFLAVHKWHQENGLGGGIWKKVVFTPWTDRISKIQTVSMHRRVWQTKV